MGALTFWSISRSQPRSGIPPNALFAFGSSGTIGVVSVGLTCSELRHIYLPRFSHQGRIHVASVARHAARRSAGGTVRRLVRGVGLERLRANAASFRARAMPIVRIAALSELVVPAVAKYPAVPVNPTRAFQSIAHGSRPGSRDGVRALLGGGPRAANALSRPGSQEGAGAKPTDVAGAGWLLSRPGSRGAPGALGSTASIAAAGRPSLLSRQPSLSVPSLSPLNLREKRSPISKARFYPAGGARAAIVARRGSALAPPHRPPPPRRRASLGALPQNAGPFGPPLNCDPPAEAPLISDAPLIFPPDARLRLPGRLGM